MDGVRGIAIILVVLFHNFGFTNYFKLGWLGVDLFFVLSGYLITNILIRDLESKNFLRNFYIRRVLRIFPLYYFFLIIFLLILPNFTFLEDNLKYYTENQIWLWTYTQNWLFVFKIPEDTNILVHLWSLGLEEQYYIIWPLIILLFRKPKPILFICLFFLAISIILRIALWDKQIEGVYNFGLHTFTRIDGICIGSAFALVRLIKRDFINKNKLFILSLVVICNITFYFIYTLKEIPFSYFPILGYTTFAILFALFINEALTQNKTVLTSLLNFSALRFIGNISYSLYIFHWPVYRFLSPIITDFLIKKINGKLIYIEIASSIIITLASLLISILSFYFFERKFLNLKKYFT